jgi:preprotein translocase subunit SecG
MITLVTIIHVIACLFLILVVLLQAGKGGGVGIAFGSAGSQQVFGGRGAGGFLEKLTAGSAIVFMLTSVTLAYKASKTESSRLQEMSEKHKKESEAKKAEQAKKDKEAEEAARKALEEKAKAPAPSTSAPAPSTNAPAPPANAPAPPANAPPAAPTK